MRSFFKLHIRSYVLPQRFIKNLILYLALLLAFGYPSAYAQRCGATCASAESLLGLSEQALVAMIPDLERAERPVLGPRNTRGKWVLRDIRFGTEQYVATYFIRSGKVMRIEYLSTADRLHCSQRLPFELAVEELKSLFGPSQVLDDFENEGTTTQSAAFNTYAVVVSVHLTLTHEECSTRVIFRPRELRDASEL